MFISTHIGLSPVSVSVVTNEKVDTVSEPNGFYTTYVPDPARIQYVHALDNIT